MNDEDCPFATLCLKGLCRKPGIILNCGNRANCPNKMECKDGKCVSTLQFCTIDSNCPQGKHQVLHLEKVFKFSNICFISGFICKNRKCIVQPTCSFENPCFQGLCIRGICQTICDSSFSCRPNYHCLNGACVPNCKSFISCGQAHYCQDNKDFGICRFENMTLFIHNLKGLPAKYNLINC